MSETGWPEGFFESVRISRKDFRREAAAYVEKKRRSACSIPTSASTCCGATGLRYGRPVVTDNTKVFRGIGGLELEDWR